MQKNSPLGLIMEDHMKKLLGILSCGIAALIALCGCTTEPQHVHDFLNYTIVEPSCEGRGVIEQTCAECGQKNYIETEPLGHNWQNGVCLRCGISQNGDSEIETPDEEPDTETIDVALFYSIDEIYERSVALGHAYTLAQFLSNLDNTTFTDLYINGIGRLKAKADGISADVGEVRVDLPIEAEAELRTILHVLVGDGELFISDTTGTTLSFGQIDGLQTQVGQNTIQGFAINLQNELLLLYRDGSIIKAGTIGTESADVTNELMLYYIRRDGNCSVFSPLDRTASQMTVAPTHLGRSVIAIAGAAFYGCRNLRSIALPEGIQYVYAQAFENCTAMESIVMPASLQEIGMSAFSGCDALEKIFYCGNSAQWNSVSCVEDDIDSKVFFYSETQPTEIGNFWHYVDGVPTAWSWQWV